MNPGTIIVLNGTSSSGKTSIIKALQNILPEPFLEAGIDKFIWMLPRRYLNRPLWDDVLGLANRSGRIGNALVAGMHHAIAALSRAGNNVLADHVLVEQNWVNECAQCLQDLPAYLIAIDCPLPILEQREKERNDRTLGQAAAQFEFVHKYCVYDLRVDTSALSVAECAAQIKARLESDILPSAFKQIALGIQRS